MKNLLISLLLLSACHVAWSQKSQVFVTAEGAIRGYDPVAFFKDQKPVQGARDIHYTWNGATWYFSSIENKKAFENDPEKYAPQYGGYCAFGTANGYKAPSQPETGCVVDGKLYFNYNKQVQKDWSNNRSELIQKADKNWPQVKDSQ
jgi:YHS domain-containing protein